MNGRMSDTSSPEGAFGATVGTSTQERTSKRGSLGKSVVVTGASSGIGRATAREFARRGWDVIAAARQEEALAELVAETHDLSGTVTAAPADVSSQLQMERVAQQAEERFGALDVWVNDAAVSALGRFEDIPPDDFRQVIETNLMGYVHGARAAIPRFRKQGHGVLINVSSVDARVIQPYSTPYTIAKAGVSALSEALREELIEEPQIEVCTVYPGSVDTPLFQHAADFMGREAQPMHPIYPASDVARAIVSCAEKPRAQVWVGMAPRRKRLMQALMPRTFGAKRLERRVREGHFGDASRGRDHGNVFQPDPNYNSVSGGWSADAGGTRGKVVAATGVALGSAALGYGIWALMRRGRRRRVMFG